MYILHSYAPAVALCVVTMLCWGSWANTQKLAGRHWRFELFYWDYALGVLLDLPIERTAERNAYRNSLITLQRSVRDYQTLEPRPQC